MGTLLRSFWLRLAFVAAVFLGTFVVGLLWLFPYDALASAVETQVARSQAAAKTRGTRYLRLDLGELGPAFPLGLSAEGVTLHVMPPLGAPNPPLVLEVAELRVTANPLMLLFGQRAAHLDAELLNGELDIDLSLEGEQLSAITLEAEDLQLGKAKILEHFLGVPGNAKLSADIDLELPKGLTSLGGEVDLKLARLWLGDGKSKLQPPGMSDGLTLEKLSLKELHLQGKAQGGVLKITKADAPGPDATLKARGEVRFQEPIARSSLDLTARVRLEQAFLDRDAKMSALLELASFDPNMKRAKREDGSLQYRIRGTLLGSPRATPAADAPLD